MNKTRHQPLYTILALAALTFISRIPFRSQILYHWDSVNFANGMREFNVLEEHPQPPGYILYVWLSRLVDLLFHEANSSMVWISILSSMLAVAALYLLTRDIAGHRAGLVAGLFLAASPLFWFYGEIALPHTLDTALILVCAWLLYRIWRGEHKLLWLTVILLAVLGGVRQQSLVFLGPVILLSVFRLGFKRLALAALLGAVLCLIWFIPLTGSAGGLEPYLDKMGQYSQYYQQNTSITTAGISGLLYNLKRLTLYTGYAGFFAVIPLGAYALRAVLKRDFPKRWDKLIFLAFLALPSLAFYAFIHMGQQGLVFSFLPVLLILGAVSLVKLTPRYWGAITLLLILPNILFFWLAPEYPLGPGTQRFLTADTLQNHDRYYTERLPLVENCCAPESTLVATTSWVHLNFYLPEYALLPFDPPQPNSGDALRTNYWPDGGNQIALTEFPLTPDDQDHLYLVVFDPEIHAGASLLDRAVPEEDQGSSSLIHLYWLNPSESLSFINNSLELNQP